MRPYMRRLFITSATLILLTLCFISVANAAPQTFNIPVIGLQKMDIPLNQGDNVKLNATIYDANSNTLSIIEYTVNNPDGRPLFEAYASGEINYSFTATVSGKYTVTFFNIMMANTGKTVIVDYQVTPSSNSGNQLTYTVLLALAVAIIIPVAGITIWVSRKKSPPTKTPKPAQTSQNVSGYEAWLAKKTSALAAVPSDSNVSEAEKRRGILLKCRNAWLTNTQLYYCRNFWQTSDMAEAYVRGSNALMVRFIDGKTSEFVLAPDDAVQDSFNELGLLNESARRDALLSREKARTQKWADAINAIILKRTHPELTTVTCKYCGATNKGSELSCSKCGAPMKT